MKRPRLFMERNPVIRRILFLAGAALVAVAPLAAKTPPTAQFDPARLSQHVQTLGSDAFEGRGPATNGETKTVAYITREFQAAGLKPGGDLVKQRLPYVRRVAVDERHLHLATFAVAVAEVCGQRQPAGAAADDDDAMRGLFHLGHPESGTCASPMLFHVDGSDMHGVSLSGLMPTSGDGRATSASANRPSSGRSRRLSGSRPSTTMLST